MINLMQGDCLELLPTLEAESVDMVCCDPPYGTTACRWDNIIPRWSMWKELERVIKPKGAIVLTASQPFTSSLVMSNIKMFRYCWTWEKSRILGFIHAKKRPMNNIEDVPVFYKNQCTYNPQGLKKLENPVTARRSNSNPDSIYSGGQDSSLKQSYTKHTTGYPNQLLSIDSEHRQIHPTQKPVELMEYLVKTYTNENDTVLDFTMGSGTTGVACINLKRKFIGMELDPAYFKIAEQRIKGDTVERLRALRTLRTLKPIIENEESYM